MDVQAQIQCGAAYRSIINNLQWKNSFYAQNIICIIMYLCIYFLIVVMKTFKHHSGVSAAVCLPMMHLTEVTQTLWALQTGFTLYLTHL